MPKHERIVAPGFPHHIVQRGHRRQRVFFCDDDKTRYLHLLQIFGKREGLKIWAYCLMENHVHLVAVPAHLDSFKRGLGIAHWKYSLLINMREDWKGHLWQGRFFSCPLDESYARAAVRYAELNPVRAGLVERAEDYGWSSARAHVLRKPDPLLSESPLDSQIPDWANFLKNIDDQTEDRILRQYSSTGKPLGPPAFIDILEAMTGRVLRTQKRGPKPRERGKKLR